ncbi:hypothetical protein BHM03_00055266 [Ensete ventricosum]|nr:hypothetical protein BHM03_00055266 [Ensete ventricosum]
MSMHRARVQTIQLGTHQECVRNSPRVSGVYQDGVREFTERRPRLAERLSGVAERLAGSWEGLEVDVVQAEIRNVEGTTSLKIPIGAWMAVGLGMAGQGATLVLYTSWFNCSSWIRAKAIVAIRAYGCHAFTSPQISSFRPSIMLENLNRYLNKLGLWNGA